MRHAKPRCPILIVVAVILNAAVVPASIAQDDAATEVETQAVMPANRPHVLREGTRLVEAVGEVVRDAERGRLVFRTDATTASSQPAISELILLPSTRLEGIDRLMRSMDRQRMSFEITGRVYLYLGRNYLLAQQAIQSGDGMEQVSEPPTEEVTGANDERIDPPGDDTAASRRRETEDLIAEFEQSIGSVARTNREAIATPVGGATGSTTLTEGTMIVQRRGRPMMTPDGQWRLIFDADATGFADPPMLLMPCKLLERLQQLGQRDASERAIRITGEVFNYRGMPYLMPLSYHEASDRSRLGG